MHRDLSPNLQADEETKRKRNPTAFWCVCYQAIPMQVGCIFFLIEIFSPCKLTNRLTMTAITTLTLGSRPKQGLARRRDKRETREAHFILSGVQESVKEWTLTLPRQLPLGELESRRTLESLGSDCKGQNPSVWRVLYIIGKLLKHRCLKWARITHLDI